MFESEIPISSCHEQAGFELTPVRKFQVAAAESSRPPSSGLRGALDSLVQGSLVELFAAYSVAVAPLPRLLRHSETTLPDISAAIGFTHLDTTGQVGRLTLSVPTLVLDRMPLSAGGALKNDWARELANQLMGRIKNRLLQFNVRLQVGASTLIDSASLAHQLENSLDTRVYAGRTLRGATVVTIEGLPDDSNLVYVGNRKVGCEGDAILF
jgi:hypothetical protein